MRERARRKREEAMLKMEGAVSTECSPPFSAWIAWGEEEGKRGEARPAANNASAGGGASQGAGSHVVIAQSECSGGGGGRSSGSDGGGGGGGTRRRRRRAGTRRPSKWRLDCTDEMLQRWRR